MVRPHYGDAWVASITDLSRVYGLPEDQMQQRVYALAEHIHQHYCLNSGPVHHRESRPDEHIAASMLGAMAATDWWMVRNDERIIPPEIGSEPEPVTFYEGQLVSVGPVAIDPDEVLLARADWAAQQEAKVDPAEG